jgi:hypothetical protein
MGKGIVAGIGVIGTIVAILVGLKELGVLPGSTSAPTSQPSFAAFTPAAQATAEITLSQGTAPRGATITVYGSGFLPRELVEIRIHVTTVGDATAGADGKFTQNVVVPASAPPPGFPTNVTAQGNTSLRWATAPFSSTS